MKKISLFLICFTFAVTTYAQRSVQQYIIHIYPTSAVSDKPLDEVTIKYKDSTTIKFNDYKALIFTNIVTLRSVISFTMANVTNHRIPGTDYGSFGVTVYTQTSQIAAYYLTSPIESKLYFKRFIAALTAKHADKNIIGELQKLYNRINY